MGIYRFKGRKEEEEEGMEEGRDESERSVPGDDGEDAGKDSDDEGMGRYLYKIENEL